MIFFEPGFDILGGKFEDSPGGVLYREKEVYSYHVYCKYMNNETSLPVKLLCKGKDYLAVKGKEAAASLLKVGKFITEFGAEDNSEIGVGEIDFILRLANSKFTSWAYWQFKFYGDFTT